MSVPKTERQLIGKLGAELSWANTTDRTARTAPARRAMEQRFLDEADGDPVRAEHLRRAYFTQLMGVALNLPDAEIGFGKLCVDPRPVLNKALSGAD